MVVASRKRHPPKRQAPPAPSAMSRQQSAVPALRRSSSGPPLNGLYEVNERCIELLVSTARREETQSFALISELRDLFKGADRSMRERAARMNFLLVDLQFG